MMSWLIVHQSFCHLTSFLKYIINYNFHMTFDFKMRNSTRVLRQEQHHFITREDNKLYCSVLPITPCTCVKLETQHLLSWISKVISVWISHFPWKPLWNFNGNLSRALGVRNFKRSFLNSSYHFETHHTQIRQEQHHFITLHSPFYSLHLCKDWKSTPTIMDIRIIIHLNITFSLLLWNTTHEN